MMIAKLKSNILLLVALFLGYSGWGSAQADESGGLLQEQPLLPEILSETLRLRDPEAKVLSLADPFRLAGLGMGRNKREDDGPMQPINLDEGEQVPILELQSTMRLPEGGIAFFNHRKVNQGQAILPLAGGNSPVLKAVRGPLADVEYMGVVFTLDLNNFRSLKLSKNGGEILLPAVLASDSTEIESVELPVEAEN
jgi:hypothetical protein